jgi:hypothetical protein
MLLRILVLTIATAYVAYRGYLAVQVVRARRAGDPGREQALRARALWAFRWAVGIWLLAGLFLVLLVVSNSRD